MLTAPFVSSNNGNWFPQSNGFRVTVYTSVSGLETVTVLIRAPFGMAGRRRRLLISAVTDIVTLMATDKVIVNYQILTMNPNLGRSNVF